MSRRNPVAPLNTAAVAVVAAADRDAAAMSSGAPVAQPPVAQIQQHQQAVPTAEAARIQARKVSENTRSRGWLGLAASYGDQFTSWITKERRASLDELASISNSARYNVPSNRTRLASNVGSPRGDLARKLIEAGNVTYAQSVSLLKTFLKYREIYSRSATNSGASRDLLVYTNRLFEDILLYLVMNDKKHKLKIELEAISSRPMNNSQTVVEGIFTKRTVNFLPWELKDSLNEVLKANAEKGRKYFLQPGQGVRELAQMPVVVGTEYADSVEDYDAAMIPAIKLADDIIKERSGKFGGDSEPGVLPDELAGRIFAQEHIMNTEEPAAAAAATPVIPSSTTIRNFFSRPPASVLPTAANVNKTLSATKNAVVSTANLALNAAGNGVSSATRRVRNALSATGTGVSNAAAAAAEAIPSLPLMNNTNAKNNRGLFTLAAVAENLNEQPNAKRTKIGGSRGSRKNKKSKKSKSKKTRRS
jgi:hypothetical protein